MLTILDNNFAKVTIVAVANFKRLKKTADQTNFGSKNEILNFIFYLKVTKNVRYFLLF